MMQDLTGQTVGQYRVLEIVGKGGMAVVYRALQVSLGREVALKVLLEKTAALDPHFSERFRREAAAIAVLRHPNILTIYDYGEFGRQAFIAMEHVPNGTLRDVIGKPLPIGYACDVIRQVALALQVAHDQGIVHRDVKPANVLFQDRGSLFDAQSTRDRPPWVVLSDFGIARMSTEMTITRHGTGIGTPEYMSPEQARGEKVDGRADVYALGILFYELVTGALPFVGPTPLDVAMKQVFSPMPLPRTQNPELPPSLEATILRATEKRPEQRFATAGEFARAIVEASSPQNRPNSGQTDSSRRRLVEPSLRRPAVPENRSVSLPFLAVGIPVLLFLAIVVFVGGLLLFDFLNPDHPIRRALGFESSTPRNGRIGPNVPAARLTVGFSGSFLSSRPDWKLVGIGDALI